MKNGTNSRCRGSLGCPWIALVFFSTVGFLTIAQLLHATDGSETWVESIRDANLDSIVFITVTRTRTNGSTEDISSTGFIVDPNGYVLTCNHVIPTENLDYVKIESTGTVGGHYYPLTIVRRDEQGDVMLLKLPQKNWRSVKSIAKAQVGSDIVALGFNPFPTGENTAAEPGSITGVDYDGRWLSNARVISGMLGGPVFNRSGAVVGIVGARYEDPKFLLIPISFSTSLLQSINSPLLTASAIRMAKTLWDNFRSFMRWDVFPKDYKGLLDACVVNGTAAGLIYFLFMLCLYGIAPSKFAAWHEWIANAGIPFSEKIAKTLAPFLLDTSHTLNAVVLRYQARARRLFDDTQEVKDRPEWVPAPLQIGNELIHDYTRPPDLPVKKQYVAGLLELQVRLGVRSERFASGRSIVSIEGPGGVGKSALAFQIARWASDSRADYRLARFPILPVLLKSLGSDPNKLNNVDEAAADSMRLIMETSKISAPLLQALLRRKRVLVVVDGVSEMPKEAAELPIRPDKGAVNTRFLVVTSRLPTNLLESHVIRPQELTIEVLDRVLDDLIAANVGSRRFDDTHRETLRMRIRSLIKDAGEGAKERGVPMIFIKLMIERADHR